MPRARSAGTGRTGRTRGSWTPRIAGIAGVVLVAGVGAAAYLIAAPAHATGHRRQLPTRVLSVQIVGLIGQVPTGADGGTAPRMLAVSSDSSASSAGLRFGAMPPASVQQGDPQWTADSMAGGTYVFIYAPSGQCLAAAGKRRPVLTLRRCDLLADQRWARVNATVQTDGHQYGQYRSLSSGRCLSVGGTSASAGDGDGKDDAALLAPCNPAEPARQLISFWWAA